jgi:hypothetical protein
MDVYDSLIDRFGTATEVSIREKVTEAYSRKISFLALGGLAGRSKEKLTAVINGLILGFGNATELSIRETVAANLLYEGVIKGTICNGLTNFGPTSWSNVYMALTNRLRGVQNITPREIQDLASFYITYLQNRMEHRVFKQCPGCGQQNDGFLIYECANPNCNKGHNGKPRRGCRKLIRWGIMVDKRTCWSVGTVSCGCGAGATIKIGSIQ